MKASFLYTIIFLTACGCTLSRQRETPRLTRYSFGVVKLHEDAAIMTFKCSDMLTSIGHSGQDMRGGDDPFSKEIPPFPGRWYGYRVSTNTPPQIVAWQSTLDLYPDGTAHFVEHEYFRRYKADRVITNLLYDVTGTWQQLSRGTGAMTLQQTESGQQIGAR